MYDPTKDPYLAYQPDEIRAVMMRRIGRLVVRFDGPPGHESGRFVEVEQDGKSINCGEWIQDGNDWLLGFEKVVSEIRIHVLEAAAAVAAEVSSSALQAIEKQLLVKEEPQPEELYEPDHKYNTQECDGYWIVVVDGEYEPAIDETYLREEVAIEACDQADDLSPLDCPHCRDFLKPTVEVDSDGFQDSYGCNACGMRGPATSVDPTERRAHVACGSWNQLVRALEGDERIRRPG